MNIILIGFMGSGKTTIGKKLAKRLGYQFVDTDQQIELEQGTTIHQMFTYMGESFFRKLETQLLLRLHHVKNTVISTGGGMVTTESNIELMKKIGTVVYLKMTVEEIWARMKHDQSRPLLQTANPLQTIQHLLQSREQKYLQADFTVNILDGSPQKVVTQIIQSF